MTADDIRRRGEALWDAVEREHYAPSETYRARVLMFQATLAMIGERQKLADELADMLAALLVEMANLSETAEIIAIAAARAEAA